jgi:hypothetical protein
MARGIGIFVFSLFWRLLPVPYVVRHEIQFRRDTPLLIPKVIRIRVVAAHFFSLKLDPVSR